VGPAVFGPFGGILGLVGPAGDQARLRMYVK
jgi:hypothetical protein